VSVSAVFVKDVFFAIPTAQIQFLFTKLVEPFKQARRSIQIPSEGPMFY
jgi:hypothetical protein